MDFTWLMSALYEYAFSVNLHFVFSFIVCLMTLWFLNGFNSSIPLFSSSQNSYHTNMA